MTKAVLLDLGNVVLGIDFRRVFRFWADAAGVTDAQLMDRWALDQAYMDHEVGLIDFEEYIAALSARLAIDLPLDIWREGWNNLWTEPFHDVIDLLPEIGQRYDLYGFTNTNDTHAQRWRQLFGESLHSFDEIFVSSEIGVRKPDPEAFLHVCKRMNTAPDAVVFVDDTLDNVHGAQQAGLEARHVESESDVATVLRSLLSR